MTSERTVAVFRLLATALAASLSVMVVGISGCGSNGPGRCPTSGKVTVNGKPAGGVSLQFLPRKSDLPPRGDGCKTDPDGSYKLVLHGPGEYAVTAFRSKITVVQGEELEGDDLFESRFRDPGRPVAKVVVHEGDNALPDININFP
jgi:hypothetical protein